MTLDELIDDTERRMCGRLHWLTPVTRKALEGLEDEFREWDGLCSSITQGLSLYKRVCMFFDMRRYIFRAGVLRGAAKDCHCAGEGIDYVDKHAKNWELIWAKRNLDSVQLSIAQALQ